MPTLEDSGTVTADGTEQTLGTETGGGTFQVEVDTTNMVLGVKLELRVYVKTLTGGSSVLDQVAYYNHVQTNKTKQSIPVMADIEFLPTLKQTAGANKDYPWKILSV